MMLASAIRHACNAARAGVRQSVHANARTSTAVIGMMPNNTGSLQRRSFFVRSLDDVKKAGNVVVSDTKTWESRRYLLRGDGMGE